MKRLVLALALLLVPSFAWAQCTGVFPNNTVCGNATGSSNTPRATLQTSLPLGNFLAPYTGAVSRPGNDKMADIVSVLDFGVDKTGVADAAAELTTMQAQLPAGASVIFPLGGTYKLNSNVTFTGRTVYAAGATFTGSGLLLGAYFADIPASNTLINNSTIVNMYGDSLTMGGATTVCTAFSSLSGYPCSNYGVGGQTSTQIASRQGGYATTVTVSGNQLVTGSNSITALNGNAITSMSLDPLAVQLLSTPSDNTSRSLIGTLCGQVGTIARAASGGPPSTSETYTFTPTATLGSPVACAANSALTLANNSLWPQPNILWAGRNNYTQTAQVISDNQAMVTALAQSNYVVLSILNGEYNYEWSSASPSTYYDDIIAINAGFASAFGAHYLDVRSYLVSLYDAANPADVVDYGHDVPPYSLRATAGTGTIGAGLDATQTSFTTSADVSAYEILKVDSEYIYILAASGTSVTNSTRGWAGTAAIHSPGVAYTATDPIHLNDAGYTAVANYIYSHLSELQNDNIRPLSNASIPYILGNIRQMQVSGNANFNGYSYFNQTLTAYAGIVGNTLSVGGAPIGSYGFASAGGANFVDTVTLQGDNNNSLNIGEFSVGYPYALINSATAGAGMSLRAGGSDRVKIANTGNVEFPTSLSIGAGAAITSSGPGGALASAAFASTGTSGATLPYLNGNNTFSGNNIFSGNNNYFPSSVFASLPPASANSAVTYYVSDVGVNGSLWRSNGTKWGLVNGSTVLVQNGMPWINLSSGSIAADGSLTGITALLVAHAEAWCYLPANAVATVASAGWYYCTFATTSTGTVFLDQPGASFPIVWPASPTAVTDGKGAYTGVTTLIQLPKVAIPANSMGINGQVEARGSAWQTSSQPTYYFYLGSSSDSVQVSSVSTANDFLGTTANKGIANSQIGNLTVLGTGPLSQPNISSIDTTAATTANLGIVNSSGATKNVEIIDFSIKLLNDGQ